MRRRDFLAAAMAAPAFGAARRKSRHIVLFTSDGVRWQDLFIGIDPELMHEKSAGMGTGTGPEALRSELWKPTPEERRAALMPFFWNTLVPRGMIFGNVNKGCSMQVSNRYRVSYPGYSEILTGRRQDDVIKGNDEVRNPTPSFLQFLKEKAHLQKEQVAVFASWNMFHWIAESRPGDLFINAGYESSPLPKNSEIVTLVNRLQRDARYLDSSSRHDAFTFELAMEYLAKVQPEHLFISFDETDDWAHDRRYDQVLRSLQYLDHSLKTLWEFLQRSPKYRDSTTLVVTVDHGRGSTLKDWSDHGPKVPGDEQIWAAFIGPDTPAKGEIAECPTHYQRDIAPTILSLLDVNASEYPGLEG
ncbi:MAG TPA: hypothetical protein VGL72_17220, partial [Bryobacteraceae bacterium]